MIIAPRRRKQSRRAAVMTALVLSVVAGTTMAAPEGGTVVSGSATINTVGTTTTITAANGTIINFNSFNIPAGTSVVFVQPTSTSTVLNRVIGPGPTTINGGLFANGIVYIVNPAGVIFGPSATVNVGQLYAAAGTITNEDFLKGVNRFLTSGGEVVNHGSINARGVALIGSRVANFGSIVADGNMLVMAAGDQVVLREEGSRVNVSVRTVDGASAASAGSRAGVQNAGQLRSGGDLVMVSGDMYSLAISQTGKITARNVEIHGGRDGTVEVGGFIDVSDTSRGGVGGTVTITGERVGLFDAVIDASGDAGGGTVRIGGDRLGEGPLPNSHAVYMSPLSRIYADAIRNGHGGTIIMFASDTARIFGDLFARGGLEGGDGGFIETSGRRVLEIFKTPVAVARHASGRGGTWLIDPHEITIVAGGGNTDISGANPFESTADGASLGVDLLTGAMTGGVTVIITSSAGPGNGNITFTVPIDLSVTTGTNTLQVNAGAGGSIIFQAGSGVTNGSATESLVLELNTSGGGGIQILADLTLGSAGGLVTSGASGITLGANISSGGTITLNAPVNVGGATRTISGAAITINGVSSGAGGGLAITNTGLLTLNGIINLGSGGFSQTGGGGTALNTDLTVTNGNISFADPIALGTGNRTLRTVTGGTITINGTTSAPAGGLTIDNFGLFTSNATINVGTSGFSQVGGGSTNLNAGINAGTGLVFFTTPVQLGNSVITVIGGTISFSDVVTAAGAATGLVITNSSPSNFDADVTVGGGGFVQNGTGTLLLGGNLTTTDNGSVNILRALTLLGNISAAGTGNAVFGANIALGTGVRTITANDVTLNGTTAGAGGGLVVSNSGTLNTGTATIAVNSGGFSQTGAGAVNLQGNITANNGGSITFTTAPDLGTAVRTLTTVGGGTITLPGTTSGAGGGLIVNNAGLFTTTGTVAVDAGGFSQTGAGTSQLGGDVNATNGGSISFAQSIDLNGAIRTLTTAGTGTITLNGSTGAGASGLSVNNAGLLTINGTLNTGTSGFAQIGSGNAQLNGSINAGTGNIIFGSPITLGAGTSTLTGAIVNLVGVTGPGSLTVTNSGNFVLDDPISIGGTFTQNGSGNNQLNANVTAATGISFATPIALGTAVRTLTTTAAGAPITIASTTSGAGGGLIVSNAGLFTTTGAVAVDAGGFAQTGAGTSQLGGNVTASGGGNISFAQSVGVGTAVRTLSGNDITLNGTTAGAGGGLIVTNAGTFTNNALLNLNSGGFTQNGAGTSVMNAGVNAVGGAISFATPLALGAGVIPFTGTTLTFNTITSGNATSGLQLSNAAASTLSNAVTTGSGGIVLTNSAPLIFGGTVTTTGLVLVNNTGTVRFQNTLTADGLNQPGTATASIILENATANFGTGQAVFRQPLQVDGNSTISAGQMVFLAGIIGTADKADDLTLTPTLPASATFTPIIIAGDIGTAGVRLNSLTFSGITDPNPLAAHFATVLFAGAARLDPTFRVSATPPTITDSFQVFVNTLVMGAFQRMTSFGDLTLNTTAATLGDITVLGTLTLNGTITARVRPRSDGSDAFGRADPSENTAWVATTINAGGATINANGLDQNNNPFALGPAQQNALFTGGAGSTVPGGFLLNPPRQPIDVALFADPTRTFLVPISLPAGGGSTTPTFITPPTLARIADIPDTIAPSASDIEVLRQLNIVPLPVDVPQLVEFLAGRSLYNDFRLSPDEPLTRAEVSRPRLDPTLVRAVADAYRRLSERASDEPGGAPISRFPEIQSAIGRAWTDFEQGRAPADRTGEAFGEYLRATAAGEGDAAENARQALAAIDEARALMVQVEALGLSPAEVGIVRNRLVNLLFPAPVRAAGRVLLALPARPAPSMVLAR